MKYDKEFLNSLKDDIKQSGWTRDIRIKLLDHLAQQNPQSDPTERREKMRELKQYILSPSKAHPIEEMLPIEEEEEKKVFQEATFDRKFKTYFLYKNAPLKIADMRQEGFKSSLVKTKGEALRQDLGDFFRNVAELLQSDDVAFENLKSLIGIYNRDNELKTRADKEAQTYVDIGWADEIGDMQLSRWSSRDKIYNYWANIYGRFDDLETSVKEFLQQAELLEESDFNKDKKNAFKEFHADVDKLSRFVNEKRLNNYVLHLSKFETSTPDTLTKAIKIMNLFSKLGGVIKPEKEKGKEKGADWSKDPEGARVSGWVDPTQENLIEDLLDDFKERKGGMVKIELDPIQWYENHKDFESIKISEIELHQIEELITGSEDRGGLKHFLFDEYPQYKASFEKWYEDFKKQSMLSEEDKEGFYLPVSPFIIEQGRKIGYDKIEDEKGRKRASAMDNLEDDTIEFLELVVEIDKSATDSFSVYQRKMTGKNPDRIMVETFKERKRPAVRGKGTRYIPEKLDGAWNNMIKQINLYYLMPASSKYVVQQKERPRWVKGRQGLILALKEAKLNPIGAFLDRTLDYGLEGITARQINNLTDFIDMVRQGGVKNFRQTDIYRSAKRAVTTLNKLFGKEFSQKNKQSIGSLIYDIGEKTGYIDKMREEVKEIPLFMGEDLAILDAEYQEQQGKQHLYPIDMLRFAVESPEFTAWLGISEDRDIWEEKLGQESMLPPATVKALIKLKNTLETFHNMDRINESLLYAHDTIRKMENRPVLHASLSLVDITHMDKILTKMEIEYDLDLTVTEINKIVDAVASYDSIARNYGINEDAVYTIKSMFR